MISHARTLQLQQQRLYHRRTNVTTSIISTTIRRCLLLLTLPTLSSLWHHHRITTTSAFTILNPTNGGHSRIGNHDKKKALFGQFYSKDDTFVVPQAPKKNGQHQPPTESLSATTTTAAATSHQQQRDINTKESVTVEENGVPLSMDIIDCTLYDTTFNNDVDTTSKIDNNNNNDNNKQQIYIPLVKDGILPTADPSQIEFVTPEAILSNHGGKYDGVISNNNNNNNNDETMKAAAEKAFFDAAWTSSGNGHYPFAAMMQCSGPYIANHVGKIAVFHIPGDLFDNVATADISSTTTVNSGSTTGSSTGTTVPHPPQTPKQKYCDALLQDIALCWLLDMKIVIVAAVQYSTVVHNSNCNNDEKDDVEECDMTTIATTTTTTTTTAPKLLAHECHNALKVTSRTTLRQVEEEAGFLRTELERKLNRCLRAHHHGGISSSSAPEGNVVSGNFYTAHRFGTVRGVDYEYTGYACDVHTQNIRHVLDQNDIVLLSTVGLSTMGELVNVNGYHLAATVAASLQASKVIYIASQGAVLRSKKDQQTPIQELPVSFAESITAYHQVSCTNMGFATFQNAKEQLQDPSAVELLLHMAWSCWSVKNGTGRAHICNPSDGSVLEELFTSKNGANTCIYHDNEISSLVTSSSLHLEDDLSYRKQQKEWDDFFASASAQGQTVEYFM